MLVLSTPNVRAAIVGCTSNPNNPNDPIVKVIYLWTKSGRLIGEEARLRFSYVAKAGYNVERETNDNSRHHG